MIKGVNRFVSCLKARGMDSCPENYINVCSSLDTWETGRLFIVNDKRWRDVCIDIGKSSVCFCGQQHIKSNYLIVHKDLINDIKKENVIILGSSCILSVSEGISSLSQVRCKAGFQKNSVRGCGFAYGRKLKCVETDKKICDYYENKKGLWARHGVCHRCANIFVSITLGKPPSGCRMFSDSIYEIIQDGKGGGKKKLRSYCEWLQANELHKKVKWADWWTVANLLSLPPQSE